MTLELTKNREQVAELLGKPTRVQLGEAIFDSFNEVQLFEVKYEILEPVIIDKLDELKQSTGLTAHLITLNTERTVETEDVDGISDGYGGYDYTTVLTDVNIEQQYIHTIYKEQPCGVGETKQGKQNG